MKKIALCLMATWLSLTFMPLQSKAATIKPVASSLVITKPAESAEANALLLRLNEIYAMDKTNMPSPEKRKLRKEVRSINHQLKEIDRGIYISVGAAIIIVLLLIIIL